MNGMLQKDQAYLLENLKLKNIERMSWCALKLKESWGSMQALRIIIANQPHNKQKPWIS